MDLMRRISLQFSTIVFLATIGMMPASATTVLFIETDVFTTNFSTTYHFQTNSGNGNVTGQTGFAGSGNSSVTLTSATLTWDFVKRVKDVTKMKVLIKGLESADDAALAVRSGADGIIVSNHGGRATETGRPTIDALPEVVQGAGGRIPVLLDGGVRRGTDVFKALALGATAVGIGRPYIWGLSSFGQAGVERVLEILDGELRLAMVGCGTVAVKDITATSLIDTRSRM